MFGLTHWLSEAVNILTWWALGIAILIIIVCAIIQKWFGAFAAKNPAIVLIQTFSTIAMILLIGLKTFLFMSSVSHSQDTINTLKKQLDTKAARVTELEQEAQRKQTQTSAVTESDKKAETKYLTKYRTIERIVREPDLGLANRMALDLTVDFYTPEATDGAKTPIN